MNLTEHFTLSEFTISQEAARRDIDNMPDELALSELKRTAELLEKVRALLGGVPILISSGYRCPKLNAAVGGSSNSAHLWGGAADFTAPGFGTPGDVAIKIARESLLDYDQLILEFGSWVHIGRAMPTYAPRRQLLTIDRYGTRSALDWRGSEYLRPFPVPNDR